jgi:hypothetical protein
MVVDGQHRVAALELLRDLSPDSNEWEPLLSAVTMTLVDALLGGEVDALEQASDPLRDALASLFEDRGNVREMRGWLLALLEVTRWGLERLPASDELRISRNTQAWRFLQTLSLGQPRNSSYIKDRLDSDASQVSRLGRDLLARGLVLQRRLGREAMWELTPRGRKLVREGDDDAAHHVVRRAAGQSEDDPPRSRAEPKPTGRAAASKHRAKPRRAGPAAFLVASSRPPAKAPSARTVRYVVPDPHRGGWRIAKEPGGKTIQRIDTKPEAIERAREIVERAGGGVVQPHGRDGRPGRPVNVAAPTPRR